MKTMKKNLLGVILILALCLSAVPVFADSAAAVDRAAVVEALYELEGEPVVVQMLVFDDAAGNAVTWAYGAGVLSDADGYLFPNGTVTQSELSTMLARIGGETALSLWTDAAPAKTALTTYMAAITDESSPNYILVTDCIACSIWTAPCSARRTPNYFDYTLLKYRVLEAPDYKDKASDFEKEVANKIKEQNETGKSFSGLEVDHGKAVASAFAGMTIAEFNAYIQEFKQQPIPSYDGMLRSEGWYLPMQEIGQQPVLSFGNSTGDSSMAEYVTYNNQYKSLAFMLCCDDTVRENGDEAKAQKMFDLCEEFDWVPISMKNDWTTIYGDSVTHK